MHAYRDYRWSSDIGLLMNACPYRQQNDDIGNRDDPESLRPQELGKMPNSLRTKGN